MQHQAISTSLSKIAISSLLFLVCIPSFAQQYKKKIVPVQDTIPTFRGVQVSTNLVGPVQLAVSDYGQYEGAVKVNLKDKYFPTVELGYGKANAENASTKLTYKTNAPYFKAGVDFNLMKDKHDIYRIYGGFRYAFTNFKYNVASSGLVDPIWKGNTNISATGISGSFHWLEALFAIDAKIWGPLRLGWSFRYRRRLIHNHGDIGAPWYVPGYGRYGNARLGGTFNVALEF